MDTFAIGMFHHTQNCPDRRFQKSAQAAGIKYARSSWAILLADSDFVV